MIARAEQRLASAKDDAAAGRYDVGFESARAATELAAKALLLTKTGSYPTKDHNVAGHLHRAKLLPPDIAPKALSHFLDAYTRGDYGFAEPVEPRELRTAIKMAELMIAFAKTKGGPL
jgi:HEPN domain-containing protein